MRTYFNKAWSSNEKVPQYPDQRPHFFTCSFARSALIIIYQVVIGNLELEKDGSPLFAKSKS